MLPTSAHRIDTTVGELGEDGILAVLQTHFAPYATGEGVLGPGDDAAIIPAPNGNFVMSTDAMNEGHHFLRQWASGIIDDGYSTGWKLVAQNISDMNAMGAVASAINLSLAMPQDTPVAWVSLFGRGIANACRWLGAGQTIISGGDLTRADTLATVITATGNLAGQAALRTADHDVTGFQLIHTGNVGTAAAGLAVALGADIQTLCRQEIQALRLFLRPRPHLSAGPAVAGTVSAMMDVSDGILTDADRLAAANQLHAYIDPTWTERKAAPLAAVAEKYDADPREWVLTGGEDYGLLAVLDPRIPVPKGWDVIGKLTTEPQERPDITGWDHF